MRDTDSIKKTYDFLSENKITGIPIVDNDGNFYLQGAIKVKSVALPVVGNGMSIN